MLQKITQLRPTQEYKRALTYLPMISNQENPKQYFSKSTCEKTINPVNNHYYVTTSPDLRSYVIKPTLRNSANKVPLGLVAKDQQETQVPAIILMPTTPAAKEEDDTQKTRKITPKLVLPVRNIIRDFRHVWIVYTLEKQLTNRLWRAVRNINRVSLLSLRLSVL